MGLLVLGGGILAGPAAGETVPFYIVIGQSNTGWTSSVQQLTPENAALYQGLIPQTKMWNPAIGSFDAVWGPLNVGYNTCCEDSFIRDAMGPEASLLRSLQTQKPANRRVFKHGKAGSSLGRVPNGDGWAPPANGQPGATRWVQFTTWLSSATAQADAEGDKLDLRGIIWMQGEEDALDDVNSAAYLVNLREFFAAVDSFWQGRAMAHGFPSGEYQRIIGRILLNRPFSDRIRQAQADFCADATNRAGLIDTDNYERIDSLHYSANGQVRFGLDIFNAARFEPVPPAVHLAYSANTATGNQAWQGELGQTFTVNPPDGIVVTQLGAFDHQDNGITGTQGPNQDGVRVAIFDHATHAIVPGLDVIIAGSSDPLSGHHRLRTVTPVTLPPGSYVVVAKGYNASELMNNSAIAPGGVLSTADGANGALSFVESNYGDDNPAGFGYPAVPYPPSSHAFTAATFAFRVGSPVTTFAQWRENNFAPSDLLNPSVSGPTSDPDGDGKANLIEYYFSTPPWTADLGAVPLLTRANGELQLTYQKDTRKTDVVPAAETSPDLAAWTTNGVTDELVSDGVVQIRRARVSAAGPSRFLRLRLTK